eukprot:6286498-Amphidinium_carterae.1
MQGLRLQLCLQLTSCLSPYAHGMRITPSSSKLPATGPDNPTDLDLLVRVLDARLPSPNWTDCLAQSSDKIPESM